MVWSGYDVRPAKCLKAAIRKANLTYLSKNISKKQSCLGQKRSLIWHRWRGAKESSTRWTCYRDEEFGESYLTKCEETDAVAGVWDGRKISSVKNRENCKEIEKKLHKLECYVPCRMILMLVCNCCSITMTLSVGPSGGSSYLGHSKNTTDWLAAVKRSRVRAATIPFYGQLWASCLHCVLVSPSIIPLLLW